MSAQPTTRYSNSIITRLLVYFDDADPSNKGWAVRWDVDGEFESSDAMDRVSPRCGLPTLIRELEGWIDNVPSADEWSETESGWEWRA